jgi:hypothetical protein
MMKKAHRHRNHHPPFFFSLGRQGKQAIARNGRMLSTKEDHLHCHEKLRG